MPVKDKPVKKRGPYKKKEILPPAIGEPVSPPVKSGTNKSFISHLKREKIEIDPFAILFIKWIGKGDFDIGLNKILSRLIILEPGSLEKLRNE